MTPASPQIRTWKSAVERLETDVLDVWAAPVVSLTIGFALAAAALLAERLPSGPYRQPIAIVCLGLLTLLAPAILWRTRRAVPSALAGQIVLRVTHARQLIRALPADVRAFLADDLLRLSRPITPWAILALTAFALVVSGLAAFASMRLAGALFPQLGIVSSGVGLLVAAIVLPGHVRLLTATAAQRIEERAVLVEQLAAIAAGR